MTERSHDTLPFDLLHLLAPALCPGCSEPVGVRSSPICQACLYSMDGAPYPEEIMSEMLQSGSREGWSELSAVGSLFRFEQDGPIQRILHAIKYRGCRSVARFLGEESGKTLSIFPEFCNVGVVVPIPLHPARFRSRGYNQAAEFGRGIARSFAVTQEPELLSRTRNTPSQTLLNESARAANVSGAFSVRSEMAKWVDGRRVLLVDDVLTTGSTLKAAASALLSAGAVDVIGATLAYDNPEQDEAESSAQPLHV